MVHKVKQELRRPIIVCTDKRGVFFGYVPASLSNQAIMEPGVVTRMERARMAVRWTKAEKGVMGLGAVGPGDGCRIGPAVTISVKDVHSVIEPTPEAVERWEAAPWS